MTVFLAALFIFSVVIALMWAAQLARRATGHGGRCATRCTGCVHDDARDEGG